jgi:hypothetical protein
MNSKEIPFSPFFYVKLGTCYIFNFLFSEEVRSGFSFKVIIWIHNTRKFRIVFFEDLLNFGFEQNWNEMK